MLRRYQIENSKIVETADEKAPVLLYVNPDEAEKRRLVETYQIDEHTLNSALDPDEQARLECEPNHIAFIYKRPKNYSGDDQLLFKASTMGVFYFGELLILVVAEDTNLFEGKQLAKVASVRELMIRLIYRSIFHFMEHLRVINTIADDVEQKINKAMENKYLINLFALQKSLVYYQNAVNSNGALIEKIRHNAARFDFTQEELELLDDIVIENNQCYRQAEVYSNILASLMDARASIVSNNLNVLMKTLNIITISIMVPTLVVSIFSMNVTLPFGLKEHPAFWLIMGLGAVSMVGFLIFWKYKKW
ncbi:MAG: divalent metal ion transporter [Candidatus Aminicenantes bacterium RBG_16_63_14]|nr:MAG: divalent metal ion transporter [Candidatus Aminicenantes bacterium RBG_16_63_14]OGD25991.1 MAG: divalent metal ion transporter [Candidatus Aminicenantes bacterium RBG_19FT_COMBO_65_30]